MQFVFTAAAHDFAVSHTVRSILGNRLCVRVSHSQDFSADGLAHTSASFFCMKRGKQNNSKAVGIFGLDIREALSLKQDLNVGQAVSQQQILHILQADRHCDGACKSRKDNPNCLCGVVPAAGSYRRKGLWQKEPQGLMQLGANPSDQKRQVCILITSRCAKICPATAASAQKSKLSSAGTGAGCRLTMWPQQPWQHMLCE